MYHYAAERKADALQHALDANGEPIRCGKSVLAFDGIYGWVQERHAGQVIARWAPTIDYTTMQATSWRKLARHT